VSNEVLSEISLKFNLCGWKPKYESCGIYFSIYCRYTIFWIRQVRKSQFWHSKRCLPIRLPWARGTAEQEVRMRIIYGALFVVVCLCRLCLPWKLKFFNFF